MEVIHDPPQTSDFTPLSTHQSQTPPSFHSGPPILHHHSAGATLKIHASELDASPILSTLAIGAIQTVTTGGDDEGENGADENENENEEDMEIDDIDIWVTSVSLLLYSSSRTTGLSIPYPTISLHAIQPFPDFPSTTSLFLQLQPTMPVFDDHDPEGSLNLRLIPKPTPFPTTTSPNADPPHQALPSSNPNSPIADEGENKTETSALYAALSACAALHPDPLDDDEDEDSPPNAAIMVAGTEKGDAAFTSVNGGAALPPPMPGSGGWITAENVGEYFDGEGNWRGGAGGGWLGAGAGSVRGREGEEVEEEVGYVNGEGGGGEEETKWRRTG